MSDATPKLTEEQVESYIYGPYFDRGRNYYNRGYIHNPVRRGNTLEARCSGSMPNPYRVRVTLGTRGIESTDCSCPIGSGCKHVAAMLLTWVHHPERFVERKSIDALLEGRSKNELVALIKEMIKRDPDLELLLDLPLPGTKPRRQPVDPEPYRHQVRNAFYGAEEWDSHFGVAGELGSVVDMADQFAEAEDWRNAQIIYQVVVEEGLANYEHAFHDEGEIIGEIDRAAEGLADCLAALEGDPVTRQGLLRSLFDVIRWDTNMGGYGVGDSIPGMVFEQMDAGERQLFREWIMREAEKADGMESFSRKWRKEHWARLLLQLDEQEGDIEGFLAQAKAMGMYRTLFNKLVELKRIEEAVEIASVHLRDSDYDFLNSALTLEKAGYTDEAVRMVQRDAAKIQDSRLLAWLAEKYEAMGDLHGTLNLQLRRWEQRPDIEDYKTLERLARALGQWEALRPRLMDGLRAKKDIAVLARVHLYEKDWDAAWEVAEWSPPAWGGGAREEVAQATEKHRPQKAVEYYLYRATKLIEARGRNNYASAAGYLHRVRKISEDTGQMGAWLSTIRAIRENNRNLPALQDELNKAGL